MNEGSSSHLIQCPTTGKNLETLAEENLQALVKPELNCYINL
jgi:hypothetical protein